MPQLPAGQAAHSYGEWINQGLLDFIGPIKGTVLDIGCGIGTWGPALRSLGAARLIGLEPTADGDQARELYDDVLAVPIQEAPISFLSQAQTVILADVLEHLPDPWLALDQLREAARPGTRLIVSLPNAQATRQLLPLLLRGRFDYSPDGGWLDIGHLRWFTQKTLRESLAKHGWRVQREGGYVLGRFSKALLAVSLGRATGMAYYQLHVEAVAV